MQLSIVVPVLNEAEHLPALLDQLQSLRARGHELIVVDGGSSDDTVVLAEARVDHLLHSQPGRAMQMNAGAARAGGDWLLFLHADTFLPQDADGLLMAALKSYSRGSPIWGRFDLTLSGRLWVFRIIEALINVRSRLSGIATGDQAIFVERAAFKAVGGFAAIALMEDIELSRRLKRIAAPVFISTPVISSSRRWEQRGVIRTILLMWQLRLLYFFGVAPERLARRYRSGMPVPQSPRTH